MQSCSSPDPNLDRQGEDKLSARQTPVQIEEINLDIRDTLYVPLYSDIYLNKVEQEMLLAATLSLRNTSLTDSLFIEVIDYYDTSGELVREYIESPIALRPMESIDYVIEKEDKVGGSGANFIVIIGAERKISPPIIQAIMLGSQGNHGYAFTSDARSIAKR